MCPHVCVCVCVCRTLLFLLDGLEQRGRTLLHVNHLEERRAGGFGLNLLALLLPTPLVAGSTPPLLRASKAVVGAIDDGLGGG